MRVNKFFLNSKRGFTLLEILLVVAMIAILAGIVIIAINPAKQMAEARNAQRASDIKTILDAIYQYSIDNNGNMPGSITATLTDICYTPAHNGNCSGYIDLSALTNNERYLTSIPKDPSGACNVSNDSCYQVAISGGSRITVYARLAELGKTISATK